MEIRVSVTNLGCYKRIAAAVNIASSKELSLDLHWTVPLFASLLWCTSECKWCPGEQRDMGQKEGSKTVMEWPWLVGQTSQNSNHIISHLIRFHPTTGGAISSRWYYHSHWRTVPCNSNPWHNFNINGIFWPLTVQPSFGQAINCLNKDSSIKMTNLLGNDVWREWVEGRGIDKWGVGSWSASFCW